MKKIKTVFGLLVLLFISVTSYAQDVYESPSYQSNDLKIQNKIQIYPNPSTNFIRITIKESSLANPKISIRSIIGIELVIIPQKISSNEFIVNIQDFLPGYYLLAVKDDSTAFSKTYKFLKY